MRRSSQALLGLFALLAGSLAATRSDLVRAQTTTPAVAGATEAEAEALRLFGEEKMVSARTKAEEAIHANPRSFIGHYVLGCVLRRAEGALARSMFHLGKAREIYETSYSASTRPEGAPWELHRELLYEVQELAAEMEMHEYRLHVLGYHDYLYDPDLLGETAWTLMQLHRFDEARTFATRAMQGEDAWERSMGLNALCAIEGEARTREPYYLACKAALDAARAEQSTDASSGIAVDAYNAALAANAALRFDEAESFAADGARRLEETTANPWRILVQAYLEQGRVQEAVDALRNMQSWRKRQPAYLLDQDRAETESVFAVALLVAGETELGLTLLDRAIAQPDRRGLTSGSSERSLGGHALVRRSMSLVHAERLSERASMEGTTDRWKDALRASAVRWSALPDEERVASVLATDDGLMTTLRLYVAGGLEGVPVWLVGDLVQILGPGVVSVALQDARRLEVQTPALTPYYDGLEAEIALERGDEGHAYTVAQRALAAMPERQRLLRARISFIAAEAARRDGKDAIAFGLYEQGLQLDASAARRMRIALPATIRTTGSSAIVTRAAELLERSPRFDTGGIFGSSGGFEVAVSDLGAGARACLRSAQGNQLTCAQVVPEEEESSEDAAARLAYELHQAAFAPPVSLSSTDLNSLDGRTTTSQEVARERLHQLLDDVTAH